jgi:hypothetical protein
VKRYTFADFNTEEKPRIVKYSRAFGARVYTYRCTGRSSDGYGTTPADAYNAWNRNWRRRFKFYSDRASAERASAERVQLSKQIQREEEWRRKHYFVNRDQLVRAADDFDVVPE